MRRLPPVPEIQRGGGSWSDIGQRLRIGDLCIVALVRGPHGQGTHRLDRIAAITKNSVWREIAAVESGLPIVLNSRNPWNGERHWITYALTNAPGDIRARDAWEWWISEGRPSYRWPRQMKDAMLPFVIRKDVAA